MTVKRSLLIFGAVILCVSQGVHAQQNKASQTNYRVAALTEDEIAIWNDPAFKKQFVLSYLAETDVEPRITQDERETMIEILDLIAAEEMDKAVVLLQKNRGEKSSAVFDFTLANIHFQSENLEQAAADYQVAVGKWEKFRRAWRNLGLIYVRLNKYEEAIPALTKVIQLGGADALTYGLLGFCYSNVGKDLSAESAFRMANLLDPETMDWKMGLARSFFKQERFADAASLTKQLLKDYPERSDLWLLQANAYIGMNEPMKAAENYEIVDRLGGSTSASLNMLGDIYINNELFDVAAANYIRAMEMDEKVAPDRAIRAAKALTARGELSVTRMLLESIERLRGSALSDDTRKELLKLHARIAVAEGAGDEEAKVLEQIVAMDPLDGEALILLGQHCSRNEEPEKAIFYYERAESIEKYEADAKVRHAQLLVQLNRYDEAIPLLRSAQQITPRDNVQKYLEQVERVQKGK